MKVSQTVLIPLASGILIVVARLLFVVFRLWGQPLDHGPGYFLGVAVPPGFYDGPGIVWLKRYRTLLVLQYLLLFSVFTGVVVSGRWSRMPVLAPVDVVSFFAFVGGINLWARRALGSSPPVLARVAVPLEVRRAGRYISWSTEALLFTLLAVSWLLLLTGGQTGINWGEPALTTYVVLGILPGKLILARSSFPLPPDRTEEHYRWMEEYRRYSLLVLDAMCWLCVVILVGYAVMHGWAQAKTMPAIRWFVFAVAAAISLAQVAILIRGGRRLAAMGRELRPVGSWRSPFRPSPQLFVRGGLAWGVPYCIGLVLLMIWFRA